MILLREQAIRKPVQDRCGRCNEPSPVRIFEKYVRKDLSADENRKKILGLSWADKMLQKIKEGVVMIDNKKSKKKFVRYQEGAEIYSMSIRKFQDLAKDAGAIYKVGKMALVNCELFDKYLETFRL